MNKKQLIVTSILLSLMLILAIAQGFFKDNFEQVVLMDKRISEFKQYDFDEGKYIISLPSEWIVDEKESEGQYVSYKLNFKDKNNKFNGLVEVINTKEDLDVFAENDLNNQYLEYYNSEVKSFKNSNNSGVVVQYETTIKNGYDFKNECYYLNLEEGKTIKILFNIKEKDYKENMKTIFNTIISSIKAS
jgi:hypothetical protein